MDYEFYIVSCCFANGNCICRCSDSPVKSYFSTIIQCTKVAAYECGIPTRGKSSMQFRVGYYLFAILFLMFDVETVFLFPWAVVVRDMGVQALISVIFFLVILVLGLAYAWRKGALEWK